MPSPRPKCDLPEEVRQKLAEVRALAKLTYEDLDRLLEAFAPGEFEEQLHALVAELHSIRLFPSLPRGNPVSHGSLPGGGLISRQYLRELDRFPEMTREEEIAYSKRMEFALARLEAAEFESQSVRAARHAEYERLRAEFIERCLHFVPAEVYHYRTYGAPLDDLVQEGNAALMRAVEKFNWRHNVRFRTYVAYWIRQAVERHLAAHRGLVRVPHHLQQKLRRFKRQGRLPKIKDADLSVGDLAAAFEIPQDAAEHLIECSRPTLSLDQEMGPDGDFFRDLLVENWEPVDRDEPQTLNHRLSEMLEGLDDRERKVLHLRFGLDGSPQKTLEEVGRELMLSRERSRQIQQRALKKLRRRALIAHLEDHL